MGSWRGGRRRKEEGGIGGEFFRAEDDVEEGVSGVVGGTGAGGGVDICRERSYSDSEAVSVTNPCESGRRSSVTRERHGSGGFEDHENDINGTSSRPGRRPLSKLRSAKLLPSSVAWPSPLSLQRRAGRSRRRTPPPPPPPDDAMVSPPPSCVLYGEDPIEAMGSFPSKGGGVGGGGFDKRMTVRSASFGREGTGHGWATPLFRQRRRGSKRGGFGSGNSGAGGFTPMMPTLVPPSPAGLLDSGSSLDALPAATAAAAAAAVAVTAAAASEGKTSEKVSSNGSRSGFVKLPSKLTLQEVGGGIRGISDRHDHNERQGHEGDHQQMQQQQQQQGALSSTSHCDRGVGTGITTTASSSFSPASSAGGGNEEEATEDVRATRGAGGDGLNRSTRQVGSSFTVSSSGNVAAAAATSGASPGDIVAPSPPLLRTPSQEKPSKTEPPRPPGRPPHAQRKQARQKQKRGGLSRITPWDSSDEMQQQAQEMGGPQVQLQQQQHLIREGRSVSLPATIRNSRPPKSSRGLSGHGSSGSSSSSKEGARGFPQEESAVVLGGSGPSPAADADAGGRAGSIDKGDCSKKTSSNHSGSGSGRRRASIAPVLVSPPPSCSVLVPRTVLSGAAVDAARGASNSTTTTAMTVMIRRKEPEAKDVIGQSASIPDGDSPVRRGGGDGDEDAVSVIGRAVLDHLMSATDHESPEMHSGGGGKCNSGGFSPPSASKSESGREVDVDDGEFLTARGEKSFFALDGDYSPEQTEQEKKHKRLGETEQTSQEIVEPSSIGSDGTDVDVVPDASSREGKDEGPGFAPPEEGGAIRGRDGFSSPGSVVGDDEELFAEAVLEEFTVDDGGCDEDTGRQGGGGGLEVRQLFSL